MSNTILKAALAAVLTFASFNPSHAADKYLWRSPIANKALPGTPEGLATAPEITPPAGAPVAGTPRMLAIGEQRFKVGDYIDITPSVVDSATGAPFTGWNYSFTHTQTIPAGLTFSSVTGAVKGTAAQAALLRYVTIQGTKLGMMEVSPGDNVPGLGRIHSIRQQDGRWVVVTSRGIIAQPH